MPPGTSRKGSQKTANDGNGFPVASSLPSQGLNSMPRSTISTSATYEHKGRQASEKENLTAPSCTPESIDFQKQSKAFLIQRITALETELARQSAHCAALAEERNALLPFKQKYNLQLQTIAELKEQLSLTTVERNSALDEVARIQKERRDGEHSVRVQRIQDALGPDHSTVRTLASVLDGTKRPAQANGHPKGGVVQTIAGPQIVYDSSSISSLGFQTRSALPLDFLGGLGAHQSISGANKGGGSTLTDDDAGEESEVERLMQMAKCRGEVEARCAEMEQQEMEELRIRWAALAGRK